LKTQTATIKFGQTLDRIAAPDEAKIHLHVDRVVRWALSRMFDSPGKFGVVNLSPEKDDKWSSDYAAIGFRVIPPDGYAESQATAFVERRVKGVEAHVLASFYGMPGFAVRHTERFGRHIVYVFRVKPGELN